MKISVAQLNPVIGDVRGNLRKAVETLGELKTINTDLVVFPELFLTGYPAQDLLERDDIIDRVENALKTLVIESLKYPHLGILMGAPVRAEQGGLYNSAILMYRGGTLFTQNKMLLPSYDVFDEARYFIAADKTDVFEFKGEKLGITICEDVWNIQGGLKRYRNDPVAVLKEKGADLIINISASPFYAGKDEIRFNLIRTHAQKHSIPFLYVNQVGGNDELVFDGRSMAIDSEGMLIAKLPGFREHIENINLSRPGNKDRFKQEDRIESIHDALVLGVRDYMGKCGFKKAIIGLSGGIDSAVTCCIAQKALSSRNVVGIYMPSEYSSVLSGNLSETLAGNLDIEYREIPISEIFEVYKRSLNGAVDSPVGVSLALENVQARIRGNILMAYSNQNGYLLLSTGNKSEMSVGYCTLYGDMSGGLAVISDVPKTIVYQLAEYINREANVIPRAIIDRPPTAELKPDQKDEDTLPPYDILDTILYCYLEERLACEEIIERGFSRGVVEWVINAVNRNEYKRRQAPFGIKVTSKAFGVGRRIPVAALY